jgi:hypothetical protein
MANNADAGVWRRPSCLIVAGTINCPIVTSKQGGRGLRGGPNGPEREIGPEIEFSEYHRLA